MSNLPPLVLEEMPVDEKLQLRLAIARAPREDLENALIDVTQQVYAYKSAFATTTKALIGADFKSLAPGSPQQQQQSDRPIFWSILVSAFAIADLQLSGWAFLEPSWGHGLNALIAIILTYCTWRLK